MSESPETRLRVKLLAVLLLLSVVLGFAEVVQRLSDWRKEARRAGRDDPYALVGVTRSGDPVRGDAVRGRLLMELTPHLLFVTQPDQRLRGLRINAQGFRGADWRLEKRSGVRRVPPPPTMIGGPGRCAGFGSPGESTTS